MATTKLFNKDGTETPKRPTWHDHKQEIAGKAVEKLFAGKFCNFEEGEKSSLIESIVDNWYEHCDTYDLGKCFEGDGWEVDRNFICDLESVDSCLSGVIREMIKEWGENNDIAQTLPLGTELDCGVIDGVYEYEPATYQVKMWEKQDNPTTRQLIKWENAVLKS